MNEGIDSPVLLRWLRAAGEASRLRLLALCGQREMSVSDLAGALSQSEPRVSRHLKILGEAGLIERVRQGQWVYYRLTATPAALAFVRGLLGQLDRRDPVLLTDRQAAQALAHVAGGELAGSSRLGRALAAFLGEVVQALPAAPAAVLLAGVTHSEVLSAVAALSAPDCITVAHSRRAAQTARAYVRSASLSCRVLEGAAAVSLNRAALPTAAPFDLIVLDRPSADAGLLVRLLTAARQLLAPAGRLLVFGRYDALELPRARVVEHPLARLRRLLGEARLNCERLGPIEADGEHVLAALARLRSEPATLAGRVG